MKSREALSKIVYKGALYYTLITAVMVFLCILFSEDSNVDLLRPVRFLLILLFSYIAAVASVLRQSRKFSPAVSLIIHFFGYSLGFYLCLVLPSGLSFSTSFLVMILYVMMYAAATAVFTKLRKNRESAPEKSSVSYTKNKKTVDSTIRKKRKEKEEYTSQFGSSNTESKK